MSLLERVDAAIRRSAMWRSLFRQPYPRDERSRAYAVMNNVFLHIHPVRVRQHAVKFAYTFCLGGLSFFLFLVLTVTGVYLMFFYVPSATQAYTNILEIQSQVTFGLLTRNIHRWAAHLMVFFVFLHMMRVFYHGAYKPPREFNWVVGVVLLFLTIMLSFTGYLLPWDQIAYWAITIGTNMGGYAPLFNTPSKLLLLGGLEVGQNTLLRFYVLHIMVLPLVAALLLAVHFWRIRKDGGMANYRKLLGEPNYSFDLGPLHFSVLRTIERRDVDVSVPEQQIAWLWLPGHNPPSPALHICIARDRHAHKAVEGLRQPRTIITKSAPASPQVRDSNKPPDQIQRVSDPLCIRLRALSQGQQVMVRHPLPVSFRSLNGFPILIHPCCVNQYPKRQFGN